MNEVRNEIFTLLFTYAFLGDKNVGRALQKHEKTVFELYLNSFPEIEIGVFRMDNFLSLGKDRLIERHIHVVQNRKNITIVTESAVA